MLVQSLTQINFRTLPPVRFFLHILFITETFVYMPIFHKEDMVKKKNLVHIKLTYCFTLLLVALIYTPRLLNFFLILSTEKDYRWHYGLLAMFLIHTFCFVVLIGMKYRDEWRKNKSTLVQSYLTSIFAPCIVMSPDSNLLLLSNLVSTIPPIVSTSFIIHHIGYVSMISSVTADLIPWLLMSPMFAWLLQAYSQRKTQEVLADGVSFKLVKFFGTMFVLRALDEVSDILTAMKYLK